MTSVDPISVVERREARRKRILANLDSRLSKITSCEAGSDDLEFPKATKSSETIVFKSYDDVEPYSTANDACSEPDFSLPEKLSPFLSPPVTESPKQHQWPMLTLALSRQMHIALLAILVCTLIFSSFSEVIYENALIPFITLELAELFSGRVSSQGGILSLVVAGLALFGVSNNFLKCTAEIIQIFVTITADFSLYLFVFILSSQLLYL